jgi:predicted Zn-dependent protease
VVQQAAGRVLSAAAAMGYQKHTLFLRTIVIEAGVKHPLGTMSGNGVAMINATRVRAARLSEADVAWVIAHEFAHFILRHPAHRTAAHAVQPDEAGQSELSKAHELEADRLGLRLVTGAGYSFDPLGFFIRARGGRLAGDGKTHPADRVRVEAMSRAVAEGV